MCSDVMMQGVGNKDLVVFGVCPAGQLQHMDPTRYPTERSADPGGGGVWGWVIITSRHQCCSVPPHPLAWLALSLCFPSPVLHLPTGQAARKHPHLPALITPTPRSQCTGYSAAVSCISLIRKVLVLIKSDRLLLQLLSLYASRSALLCIFVSVSRLYGRDLVSCSALCGTMM